MMPNGIHPALIAPTVPPAPTVRVLVAIVLAPGALYQAVCRTPGCSWPSIPHHHLGLARIDQTRHRHDHATQAWRTPR